MSVGHTPFNSHDHMRDRNGVQYSYMEVVVYIATLPGLERPYEESVLGSYTDKKAVVLSKNEGNYLYQFYGRSFDKEEED